ncbi:hypothetical protein NLI96_g10961 [Meripilus lineatus]|uniref:DUF6535 domain-containing protein n=1 Tax=Meripilus lineatus TaxID=2056292 RepID=A0AAD5UU45_9APHY|nr:hypothetical protein NLI96_g10961 [Physisporinus lineatus]
MATPSEMSAYELSMQLPHTRNFPSSPKRSSRSSLAKRSSRSSSSRKRVGNEITEVARVTEVSGPHKEDHEAVNHEVTLSSPLKPSSQSSAAHIDMSFLGAAIVSQPNQSEKFPTGGPPNTGDETKEKPGEGDEEEVTEAERFCRDQGKVYPHIILKPEDANAWPKLSDTLRQHDEDQVQAHNENIDTLLVLSGLFSAAVTTLIIEALSRLQQDPADTTAQLLLQISMQLSSLTVNSGFINSTYIPPSSSPFSPPPHSVLVVIFWSISLVLSLVVASLGMLVKQWYREYLAKSNISPEQCCQVRLFRIPGLRKYKVAEIASLLPILLQIAFILFFVGLILFVQPVHASVATVVSVFVGIWLFFIVGTTLLPIVSPSCPYKTPFLKGAFLLIRSGLNWVAKASFFKEYFPNLPAPLFIEESTKAMTTETKIKVLQEAYETFQDIQSWDIVTHCVDLDSPLESLRLLSTFVNQMNKSQIPFSSHLSNIFDNAHLRTILKSMVAYLRRASIVALKDSMSSWFQLADIVHLVTFRILFRRIWSSESSDAALCEMVDQLTMPNHIFSIREPEIQFVSSYILSISRLSPSDLPETIDKYAMWNVTRYAISALDNGSGNGAGFKCSASLPHLLEICRIFFLCAGRTTENGLDWPGLEDEFSRLTGRLVDSLQSISYPERRGSHDPGHTFRARLNMPIGTKLVDTAEYVGVQTRDDRDYRSEWYDDGLTNSCKQRIEFMWSWLHVWRDEFREILREFEVGSNT